MKTLITLLCLLPSIVYGDTLFDINVGSWWKYEVNNGELPDETSTISNVKKLNGVKWYLLAEDDFKYWIRNSDSGQVEAVNFYESIPDDNAIPEEVLIFKYPATKGEAWTSELDTITYLGIIDVRVPAGDYKCHMYKIAMSELAYSDVCIAENVGVVFNELVLDDQDKKIFKLKSFNLNNNDIDNKRKSD